jgi:hypothetical protein
VEENIQQQIDLLRKLGTEAPATAGTETPAARRLLRYFRRSEPVFPVAGMVIGVPWRLRHPRRLTVLAIAAEAPDVVFNVLRAARAVRENRRRQAPAQLPCPDTQNFTASSLALPCPALLCRPRRVHNPLAGPAVCTW